jgi:acyl-CoA synthetase (NDP forming)
MRIHQVRNICRDIVKARGETWLTADELRSLLETADLHTAPGVLAHSSDEAASLARVFGFPVVAKIISAKAVHKTEIGGVKLHLANETAVREAYGELSNRGTRELGSIEGVLIQPMLTGAVETLVGLTQHPTFGPLVAFGLGGVYVELFRDLAFRIAPLTDRDADELMRSVKGFQILEGYRNQPGVDLDALRDLLLKVSYLGDRIPELLELEFNPVMAGRHSRGYAIADARARVGII